MNNGRQHGFSLIELLLVIVIIGVLAGSITGLILSWTLMTGEDACPTCRTGLLACRELA